MRVSLLTVGTRGDIEPYVALGAGLRGAGHDVRVAGLERFRALVTGHGLEFVALPGDPDDLFGDRAWERLVVRSWNWTAHMNALYDMIMPLLEQIEPRHVAASCDDADVIVFTPSTVFGRFAALERGTPSLLATFGPFHPTFEFPHPIMSPNLRAGRLGNRLSYVIGQRLGKDLLREPIKPRSRARVGLAPFDLRSTSPRWPPFPVLNGFSPALVPRPADWPGHVRQTGFWQTDAPPGAALPAEAEGFLASGAPPVYVTFGSLRPHESERLLSVITRAAARTGDRIVLGSGFGPAAQGAVSDDVLLAGDVPHEVILPRMRAIVHHGGVGTTARGLKMGLPTLVVPFIFDQFFWGRRVAMAGAGPRPIPRHRITAESLARALRELGEEGVRRRAAQIGEQVRAEDGVGQAVGMFDELVAFAAERR